ncbi:SRPBCC domain-containing protein [Parapedobacter sp. 2B3]|uniref:SRPBCC domain-containing protein n=1 Tax=Parapedobacter sp. 2B3 TaxID=3342381 RepID=UPI0035B642AB
MKNPLGKITTEDDGYKVVFERVLPHSIEKVWNAITSPEELKFWFTDIEMDFRPGGTITFQFRDKDKTKSYGEVVAIEPPNRFAWTWEHELAVWELTALDEQTTRLVFTYSKLTDDYAINAPAGFHDMLDLLVERLAGSENISPFGAEDDGPEQLRTPVHYAAAVYETYPTLVKSAPVVVEKTLDSPIGRVWRAIANKEQLKQWYFDLDDFKPEVGFRFSFAGQGHKGAQYIHRCIVTEVIPQQKLQYSWQYEGHPGYSLVTFTLAEMGMQTKLILTHHGLETFPQDTPDFAWKSFNGGWGEIIGKMLPEFLDNEMLDK